MSFFSKRKTGIFHFVFEKKRYNRINKRVRATLGATAPVHDNTKENAVSAIQRDMKAVFAETETPGDSIRLAKDSDLQPECFCLQVHDNEILLTAADALGFVYGLFEISKQFLGVQPFWFWNDQKFTQTEGVTMPQNFTYESRQARVRYRGWFVNDETLISHWKVECRSEMPFVMVFETLLRLGGNLVIPGTGENGHRYHDLAADMGLIISHHHAEPLGAKMFVQAYPELEPKFSLYPEKFRALWQDAITAQKATPTIWNIGFRGQGDKPFWEDDPQYDTPEKRGALISSLIREQYDLVKRNDPNAICCTNLYGETMELYRFLDFQRFQTLFGCPGVQAVLDSLHQIVQLFVDLSQLLFQQRDRSVLLILDIHNQLNDLVDHRIVLNQLHSLPDDQIFQPFFLHGLFVAALAPLDVGAFIIIVGASGSTGSAFTEHQRTTLAAEQLGGQQIFLVCLATGRGTLVLIQTLLHPVKQVFWNDSRNRIRHNDIPERQFANVPTFLQHRVHAAVGHFGRGFSSNSHCSMGKSMGLPCRASQVGILRLSGKRFEPSIRKKRKIFIPTWVYSCCVRHE